MERLRGQQVHSRIRVAMHNWLETIKNVQSKRREEIINSNNRHAGAHGLQEDKGEPLSFRLRRRSTQ